MLLISCSIFVIFRAIKFSLFVPFCGTLLVDDLIYAYLDIPLKINKIVVGIAIKQFFICLVICSLFSVASCIIPFYLAWPTSLSCL